MIGRLETVVLDCADTRAAADFYCALLGLEIVRVDGDWIDLGRPGGSLASRVLSFQHAPDHVPPTWPDPAIPQQIHFDITVDNVDTAEAEVLALGARRLRSSEEGFRVYADPAGHPFCLTFTT